MSVSSAGVEGTDPTAAARSSAASTPRSARRRYVAFASLDSNLAAGDSVGQFHNGAYATGAPRLPAAPSPRSPSERRLGLRHAARRAHHRRRRFRRDRDGHAHAGVVTAINMVSGGAGYTSTPTVTIFADSGDSNIALDIFVRDRDATATGTFDTANNTTTQLVSVSTLVTRRPGCSASRARLRTTSIP